MPSSAPVPSAAPSPAAVPVPPSASKLEAFLDRHFRTVVILCLGLIAVSAIAGVLRYRAHAAAEEAAQAATAAKTVDDCDVVIQKYKGTTAAGNALLTKAKLQWEQNTKDKAVATLREFVAGYTSHPFYIQGLLSLATRLESLGANEAKEAQTIYEKIVNENKTSEIAGLAQLRIADMLWAQGKEEDAKKIYDEQPRKFIGQFPDMVDERVKWIASALPTQETDAPKPPPDSIKAPTPNPAPAINIKPDGKGTSMPFEIKTEPVKVTPAPVPAPVPQPQSAAPAPTPAPAGTMLPAPSTQGIKVEALKPGSEAKLPQPNPVIKLQPPKTDAPAAASTPPVVVPPAPTPAPAPAPQQ